MGDFIYWAEDPAEKLTKEKIYKEFYDYDIDKDWKPKLPLTYDPDIGEFFLTYTDPDGETPKRALLNTSLTSGACKFSDYENDTKFGSPTEAEIQKYRSIAWSTPTIQGVIDTLGEPDIRLGTVLYDPDEKSFSSTSHIRDIIDQICYTQLSDNVVVIFREYEDGLVVVNYAGKEKEGLH
ncbi:MAG: hypothetical protein GWN56_12970 [Nitrosopumilaceae archaeon]|nr:hypothetical protein [Nitrosopumilaceae archaeon]